MGILAKPSHKRYYHMEQYKGVRPDGSLTNGALVINEKDPERKEAQLKEYMQLSGSTKLIRIWSALHGECYEEVKV